MNMNKLQDKLTDAFAEYQYRLERPMPAPNESDVVRHMYMNEPMFRAKVQKLVSGVMRIVSEIDSATGEDE